MYKEVVFILYLAITFFICLCIFYVQNWSMPLSFLEFNYIYVCATSIHKAYYTSV